MTMQRWHWMVATSVWLGLTVASDGNAQVEAALGSLYERLARDLRAGQPMRVNVFVALCDNDSQRPGLPG